MNTQVGAGSQPTKPIDEIRLTLQAYRQRTFATNGNMTISPTPLLNVGTLQQLSRDELQEVASELAQTLFHPRVAILPPELEEFLAFISLLLNESPNADHWIKANNPVAAYVRLSSRAKRHATEPPHTWAQMYLRDSSMPLSNALWAGFAYLEGVCRRICSSHVGVDGMVHKAFSTPGKQHPVGKHLTNLGHLLELTHTLVGANTQKALASVFTVAPTATLFDWRCSSLHGEKEIWSATVVVFCLISIAVLESVDQSAWQNLGRAVFTDQLIKSLTPEPS
jgi:hypothetical protein